ncbi:hypothetical protein DBV15_11669 [Temnothorax longispinosus]|uniref:Uncharacterized protein n=1 Tax=Temnothorax longispinosus TaxID=300112 RepID=A0A4S2KF77_9HYME|nr:hypothetical protein DBV15_11669 [Temnothorax longispinosus]
MRGKGIRSKGDAGEGLREPRDGEAKWMLEAKTWQRRAGTARRRESAGAEGDAQIETVRCGEWMLASLDGPPTVPDLISPGKGIRSKGDAGEGLREPRDGEAKWMLEAKTWQRRAGTARRRESAGAEGDAQIETVRCGEWMLASLDGPPTVPDLISP